MCSLWRLASEICCGNPKTAGVKGNMLYRPRKHTTSIPETRWENPWNTLQGALKHAAGTHQKTLQVPSRYAGVLQGTLREPSRPARVNPKTRCRKVPKPSFENSAGSPKTPYGCRNKGENCKSALEWAKNYFSIPSGGLCGFPPDLLRVPPSPDHGGPRGQAHVCLSPYAFVVPTGFLT